MFMQLSSLPIGSDLLVSLVDHFYRRLLRYAKQKIIRCELPICGIPISSKQTQALYYSGITFWVRTPPMLG